MGNHGVSGEIYKSGTEVEVPIEIVNVSESRQRNSSPFASNWGGWLVRPVKSGDKVAHVKLTIDSRHAPPHEVPVARLRFRSPRRHNSAAHS